MTDKKAKLKKTAVKPVKKIKSAIKSKTVTPIKKHKAAVKPKVTAVAVKDKKQPVAKKKIVGAGSKPALSKRIVPPVEPAVLPAEKPAAAKHVVPVAPAPKPPEPKPPEIKKPDVVMEGKFEVFIPKFKAKQKLHPHHPNLKPVLAKPEEEAAVLQAPVGEVKEVKLRALEVKFPVTVKDLSTRMQVKPSDIIANLLKKGSFVTMNQALQEEQAVEIAKNFGYELIKAPTVEEQLIKKHETESKENLVPRSPVVTLMGHVDHGKTSLLDAIRKTNVTESEAGGITQHIGAYRVKMPKGAITFLDTPGHEAFSAMRARGATATDIVILVVAADDGVMPQTIEAIDHAKAAGVPIVVALNKIDKESADPDMVKKQLNQHGLLPEDWGGKTIMVGVSAKTKTGIDKLLEMVLLEAEMLELKANPNKPASGVVIESRLSRGRGPVATVLVQDGTLKAGDTIIVGPNYGKIRAMINDKGEHLDKAFPSLPVEILGLSGVPEAGEQFYVIEDEKEAKEIFQRKQAELRHEKLSLPKRISLEDIYTQIKEGKIKELKLVIKTDVQGSLEALKDSLTKMSTDEVKVDIIHSGTGIINDSDIILAAASNAIVIGFNAAISPEADERIKKEGIDVRLYRIIYDITSDIKSAMEGMLEPKIDEVFEGRAVVKQVFRVTKAGVIAGCMVVKGAIGRTDSCKLIRDGEEVYKGKIISLKRFKDDVKEVKEGFECGISLANHDDVKPGDTIDAFTIRKTARKL